MKTNADYWEEFVSGDLPESYSRWFEEQKKFLKKYIHNNSYVLEIGCGNGRNIQDILSKTKNITGIDHEKKTIINVRNKFSSYSGLEFVEAEAIKLPFENEIFDFIICTGNTFGNLDNKKNIALNEMKRVLKQSGSIILDVFSENAFEERMKVYKKSKAKIKIQGTTILFDDGNRDGISEQFSERELENIFSNADLQIADITKVNIIYLCKLQKNKKRVP